MAQLRFLNHSGFLLELEKSVLVFDYYTDPAGVFADYVNSPKEVLFFVSHSHYDHWNLSILDFDNHQPRHYFLEESCQETIPSIYEDVPNMNFTFIHPDFHETFSSEFTERTGVKGFQCFGSTDEGVSFLVTTTEGLVIHTGDLTLWDWEEEGSNDEYMAQAYTAELQKFQDAVAGEKVWLSMLPVDVRLGPKAFRGAEIFLDFVETQYLIPDHINGGVHLPGQLADRLASKANAPEVLALTTPGQSARV